MNDFETERDFETESIARGASLVRFFAIFNGLFIVLFVTATVCLSYGENWEAYTQAALWGLKILAAAGWFKLFLFWRWRWNFYHRVPAE